MLGRSAGLWTKNDPTTRRDIYYTLSKQAIALKETDQIADAAFLFERALQLAGQDTEKKLRTSFNLGVCYYLMGDFPRALVRFSEVYAKTKDKQPIQRIGYLSYVYQIIIFRWVLEFTRNHAGYPRQLHLIDDGLAWLHDVDKDRWRAPLLVEKAYAHGDCGDSLKALECARESLSIAQKQDSVSWSIGYHAMILSRYTRYSGDFQYCQQVLNEALEKGLSRYTKIQVQTELLKVLSCTSSEVSTEMVDLARDMEDHLSELTSSRTKVEAFAEITRVFATTGDYTGTMGGLNSIRAITIHDTFFHCRYLQDIALDCFRLCLGILSDCSHTEGRRIAGMLPCWIDELGKGAEEYRAPEINQGGYHGRLLDTVSQGF